MKVTLPNHPWRAVIGGLASAAAGLGESVFRMEAERPVPVVDRKLEFELRGEFIFQTAAGERTMIYILAALVPPLGLLLNAQPFSAVFSVVLIVFCFIFGWVFPVLFLVPSIHGVVAVHMKREDRKHREIVDAIERHGPPPGWGR